MEKKIIAGIQLNMIWVPKAANRETIFSPFFHIMDYACTNLQVIMYFVRIRKPIDWTYSQKIHGVSCFKSDNFCVESKELDDSLAYLYSDGINNSELQMSSI